MEKIEVNQSLTDEELIDYYLSKRSAMVRALDLLVDMSDLSKAIRSKCDDYLDLDRNFWSESTFSYLGVAGLADSLIDFLRDYISNMRSAIRQYDIENKSLGHDNNVQE